MSAFYRGEVHLSPEMVSLKELPTTEQQVLRELGTVAMASEGVTTFHVDNEGVARQLGDYALHHGEIKNLESLHGAGDTDAPLRNIYRGGGVARIKTNEGTVAFYDDRYDWYKLPGGISRYPESPLDTAIREALGEELIITTAEGATENLVIPKNVKRYEHDIRSKLSDIWKITPNNVLYPDIAVEPSLLTLNEKNAALEQVINIDLSNLGDVFLYAVEDEWFRDGNFLPTPFVLDEAGNLIGVYTDRIGYISIAPNAKLHPTAQQLFATE